MVEYVQSVQLFRVLSMLCVKERKTREGTNNNAKFCGRRKREIIVKRRSEFGFRCVNSKVLSLSLLLVIYGGIYINYHRRESRLNNERRRGGRGGFEKISNTNEFQSLIYIMGKPLRGTQNLEMLRSPTKKSLSLHSHNIQQL